MGKGIDLAREDAPLHAQVMDDFKDQLLIVLLKRIKKLSGSVPGPISIPVEEMDDTSNDMVAFSIVNKVFHFELRRKS
jgi:hypothetical protein